VQGK